jgi:hypothetical protein
MHLMAAAGVPTAPHTVCALDPTVYETARFDRTITPDGRIERHHAEDGYRLPGRVSLAKYAQRCSARRAPPRRRAPGARWAGDARTWG